MPRARTLAILALVAIAAGPGCGTRVVRRPAIGRALAAHHDPERREARDLRQLVLDAEGVGPADRLHPDTMLDRLAARFDADPDPSLALTLADLSLERARGLGATHPAEAARRYREAAGYASFAGGPAAWAIHDAAVTALIDRANRDARGQPAGAWRAALAHDGVDVEGEGLMLDPARILGADPAPEYRIERFGTRFVRPGLGVPFVARWCNPAASRSEIQESYLSTRVLAPGTAVLAPAGGAVGGAWRDAPLTLLLLDAEARPTVAWGGASVPLAYDGSFDLALRAGDQRLVNQVATIGVLQSSFRDIDAHLYMTGSYKPGKIPVVFVHGLNSTPVTWARDVNALRNDPVLGSRYQFWFYFYPTGQPIALSALQLRRALAQARIDFDPLRSDPALDRMVVVGHSMGGVISRMMVLDTGLTVWNALLNVPYDQFRLPSANLAGLLKDALVFRPVPTVRRAVFIAAPHRGSPIADGPIGRTVALLARPKADLEAMSTELVQTYGPGAIRDPGFSTGFGIDNLRTTSPLLRTMAEIPTDPAVPCHSIILQRAGRDGDGIVPYWSAHLDGVRSEVIVRSRHTRHEIPEVVEELRRILLEHLAEVGSDGSHPSRVDEAGW